MDSVSGAGPARQFGSGGKMARPRRAAGARTPYERPGSQNPVQRNPNWISRFIYSPTRVIASGAGKILASALVSDSSSSSSGSADYASDDDHDVDDEVNDNCCLKDEALHKKSKAPETMKSIQTDPEPDLRRKGTKHVIQQLLLQETFSREECDLFTNIIKSRVVDHPNTADGEDGRQHEFPDDVAMPDISCEAVMEARKWIDDKKLGSNPNPKLDHGSYGLNSCTLPCATNEMESPVFMARSYMQTRPAWASSFSVGGNSMSSSKLKFGSHSPGSWNIQEELRRVRSKATEEMLKNLSSPKTDGFPFSSEHKHRADFLVADKLEACEGDKTHDAGASLNMDEGGSSVFKGPSVPKNVEDRFQNETFPNPAPSTSAWNQGMEADKAAEATGDAPTKAAAVVLALKAIRDLKPHNGNNSTSKDIAGASVVVTSNGYPPSKPSSPARSDAEHESRPSSAENYLVNPGQELQAEFAKVAGSCELVGEASSEIPTVNEEDNVTQNSSSIPEEASEGHNQPIRKEGTMNRVRRGRGGRGRGRGRGRGKSAVA